MNYLDEINAKDRLIDAPYVRIDGTPIARNKAELYSINLLNATNCRDWTSVDGSETATAGINATPSNPNWTNSGTFTCSAQLPIYCVQQPDTNAI